MGGSGGGGSSNKQSAPPQAEPIDYGKMMAAASAAAEAQVRSQYENLIKYYPQIESLQLGTVGKISNNLNNSYTQGANTAIQEALAQRAGITSQANKMAGLGDTIAKIAADTAGQGPTSIEQELYRQAESDLALGRSLNSAETRDATQAARAALAARGLATGSAGTAAEILNRDAAAQARESARRNFAGAVNQQWFNNRMMTRDQAAQQAALAGNLMGNASNVYGAAGGLGLQAAQGLVATDPYNRAIGYGGQYAGQNLSTQANLIGNTYRSANEMAGGTATFNANMLDSRYNSYMNNQASLQAAGMQAGAMNNAANTQMWSSIIGAGLQGGLAAAGGAYGLSRLSDRREKTDIKPIGTTGDILGLTAYQYRYKDDETKAVHTGFIAQDVAKVLPEAVETVNYFGKKRLAIKPGVIGEALAEALMRDPMNESEEDEEEEENGGEEKCQKCGKKKCKECGSETNDGEMEED